MTTPAHRLVTGIACPFLKAAGPNGISQKVLPALLETVGQQCPFLQREGICKKKETSTCPVAQREKTESLVQQKLVDIRSEGRYRKFWDINRKVGQFPEAKMLEEKQEVRDVCTGFGCAFV